ncbi:hypothetical protein PG990_001662 [Apiospora arundinis]
MPASSTKKEAATFPSFMNLPKELRDEIWQYAMPEGDVPELLFYGGPEDDEADGGPPIMVNTGYPVLMHVCAESRALAQRATYFQYSRNADMKIPMRRFRPDLDVQYSGVLDEGHVPPAPGCRHVTGPGVTRMRYHWMCSFETYTHIVPPEAVASGGGEGETRGDKASSSSSSTAVSITPWSLPLAWGHRSPIVGPRYRARVRFVGNGGGSVESTLTDEREVARLRKMERHMHRIYEARCEIDPAMDPDNPRPRFRTGVLEMWLMDPDGGGCSWHAVDS